MHMHPWSRSGRALILDGLCATLARLSCGRGACGCGVSLPADLSHLPTLPRIEQSLSLTGCSFLDLGLCILKTAA